jgi:hypothetical protein
MIYDNYSFYEGFWERNIKNGEGKLFINLFTELHDPNGTIMPNLVILEGFWENNVLK